MSKRKAISIIVFVVFGVFFSFVGSIYYGLQHLSIMGGTSNRWSYNYGESYSWEKGYDSLNGWKGSFPETKCGSLYIDEYVWTERGETKTDQNHVYSTKCGTLMSLAAFLHQYSDMTVGELLVKYKSPDVPTQIVMFNELKNQGVLEDIRYKEVTIYDWNNIKNDILWTLAIPVSADIALLLIIWLYWYAEDYFSKRGKWRKDRL